MSPSILKFYKNFTFAALQAMNWNLVDHFNQFILIISQPTSFPLWCILYYFCLGGIPVAFGRSYYFPFFFFKTFQGIFCSLQKVFMIYSFIFKFVCRTPCLSTPLQILLLCCVFSHSIKGQSCVPIFICLSSCVNMVVDWIFVIICNNVFFVCFGVFLNLFSRISPY